VSRTTVIGAIATVIILGIIHPWTVRPLHDDKPTAFDPSSYAQSLWPRVLDDATQHAVDVASAVPVPSAASSVKARFIKGSGVVTAIDRASRVGVLRVQLPGSAAPTVAIQIGPVIRGTALRDAVSFIQFSNFTNQFDYAAASNALNDHVLRHVVGTANVDTLPGRTIAFVGATGRPSVEGGAIEVVPVTITVLDAGRS